MTVEAITLNTFDYLDCNNKQRVSKYGPAIYKIIQVKGKRIIMVNYIRLSLCVDAVSYTHLDVYKRQPMDKT